MHCLRSPETFGMEKLPHAFGRVANKIIVESENQSPTAGPAVVETVLTLSQYSILSKIHLAGSGCLPPLVTAALIPPTQRTLNIERSKGLIFRMKSHIQSFGLLPSVLALPTIQRGLLLGTRLQSIFRYPCSIRVAEDTARSLRTEQ